MKQDFLLAVEQAGVSFDPAIIFDVGAHVGRYSEKLTLAFPKAKLFSFEPASSTYDVLKRTMSLYPIAQTFRVALDKTIGQKKFSTQSRSQGNHIIAPYSEEEDYELIDVFTGQAFCKNHGIETIDYLKIDTEGNDLNVLVGFADMLNSAAINYIQVECTTNLDNKFHVKLEMFIHFLHPFGYRLFGIYDFERQIYATNQKLNGAWFCNAVFVREVIEPRLRRDGQN